MFPQSFLDELLARSDIVDVVGSYVSLTSRGGSLWGCCPFHNEKTPSFHVLPDKQMYYCFGCKKGGGVVQFVMEEEGLSFTDAVRFLARRANMAVPESEGDDGERVRARLLALNRDAARYFYETLHSPRGERVQAYMNSRRITARNATNFGLGAAADEWDGLLQAMTKKGYSKSELLSAGLVVQGKNGSLYDKFRSRLMFPVIDVRGDVVAFGGRIISKDDPGAKYMNSPETAVYSKRRTLYGLNLAKKSRRSGIILVEGNIDVVMLHQAGFDNTCASMGTALTNEQLRLLGRYTKELILCYDNDGAGRTATQKALELLKDSEFKVRVLELPNRIVDGQSVKQDADDFIKNRGADAFENLLSGSETGTDFRMARLAAQFDLTNDAGRIEYARAAAEFLSTLPNAVEREVYTVRAAEAAGFTAEALRSEVSRAYARRGKAAKREQERRSLSPAAAAQPPERENRYTNVRSALAEEGVVRLLVQDDSLFGDVPPLTEEEFSSPLLGRLFTALWAQRARTGNVQPAALQGSFTPAEFSRLTALLQKPESMKNAAQALRDYIHVIHEEAQKRSGEDPLLAATQKYKNKSGYGGKQNG